MTQTTLVIICWFGMMAYILGSLYLALFKRVIYLVPRNGRMRRVSASDYPSQYRAQIVVLGALLVVWILIGTVLF